MWIIHEHSRHTSAIDKYYLFETYESVNDFMKEYMNNYTKNDLDLDFYREIYEDVYDVNLDDNESDECSFDDYIKEIFNDPYDEIIFFSDDDYTVMTKFDDDGLARRP